MFVLPMSQEWIHIGYRDQEKNDIIIAFYLSIYFNIHSVTHGHCENFPQRRKE